MRRAVIIGRAAGALEEYAEACAMCAFDDVVVVGKMGEIFPDRIDYWVSFHTNLFDKWAATRAANGHPPAAHFWGATYKGRRLGEDATRCAPISFVRSTGGSSGFLAVEGVLEILHADRAVLAGIPLTREAGHLLEAAEPHEVDKPWGEADAYWTTWIENMDRLRGKVRSMSGRTREHLGAPTPEWMRGGE